MSAGHYPFGPCDILDDGSVIIQDGGNQVIAFEILGEAYQTFANAGVQALKRNTAFRRSKSLSAAHMVLPVLFNYRHALELYLKAIILAGRSLLEVDASIERVIYRTHSLEKLRPYVERIFERLGWDLDFRVEGLRSIKDLRRLIRRFNSFDSDSTKSRYPADTRGDPAWNEWQQVNVFAITAALDPVLKKLQWVADAIDDELDERARAEAEARDWGGYGD